MPKETPWWEEEAESIAANNGYGIEDFVRKIIAEATRRERERIRGIVDRQLIRVDARLLRARRDKNRREEAIEIGWYEATRDILSRLNEE